MGFGMWKIKFDSSARPAPTVDFLARRKRKEKERAERYFHPTALPGAAKTSQESGMYQIVRAAILLAVFIGMVGYAHLRRSGKSSSSPGESDGTVFGLSDDGDGNPDADEEDAAGTEEDTETEDDEENPDAFTEIERSFDPEKYSIREIPEPSPGEEPMYEQHQHTLEASDTLYDQSMAALKRHYLEKMGAVEDDILESYINHDASLGLLNLGIEDPTALQERTARLLRAYSRKVFRVEGTLWECTSEKIRVRDRVTPIRVNGELVSDYWQGCISRYLPEEDDFQSFSFAALEAPEDIAPGDRVAFTGMFVRIWKFKPRLRHVPDREINQVLPIELACYSLMFVAKRIEKLDPPENRMSLSDEGLAAELTDAYTPHSLFFERPRPALTAHALRTAATLTDESFEAWAAPYDLDKTILRVPGVWGEALRSGIGKTFEVRGTIWELSEKTIETPFKIDGKEYSKYHSGIIVWSSGPSFIPAVFTSLKLPGNLREGMEVTVRGIAFERRLYTYKPHQPDDYGYGLNLAVWEFDNPVERKPELDMGILNTVMDVEQGIVEAYDHDPSKRTKDLEIIEQEPYYHLMDYVSSHSADDVLRNTRQAHFFDMLSHPEDFRGKAVRVEGVLVKIQRIYLDPNPMGIHQLYKGQLAMGGRQLVTFILLEKPEGLDPEQQMYLEGIFLKKWGYVANKNEEGKNNFVFSPFIIAKAYKVKPKSPSGDVMITYIIVVVVVITLILFLIFGVAEKRHADKFRKSYKRLKLDKEKDDSAFGKRRTKTKEDDEVDGDDEEEDGPTSLGGLLPSLNDLPDEEDDDKDKD